MLVLYLVLKIVSEQYPYRLIPGFEATSAHANNGTESNTKQQLKKTTHPRQVLNRKQNKANANFLNHKPKRNSMLSQI
jgi:hypothetical protein